MISNWIDISMPLYPGMLQRSEDPPFQMEPVTDRKNVDKVHVSKISMSSHAGTHIGAPVKYGSPYQDHEQTEFSATIGLAKVIEIQDRKSVKAEELKKHRIYSHDRILLKTRNSASDWYSEHSPEDTIFLDRTAAAWLAERRVSTVGIDALFIGGKHENGKEIARMLIQAGIVIIEGLEFSRVKPGEYMLICLPLKIPDGDGAPARAILQPVR
ncbi:cyclase family protein [Candidatus Nitrospira allomarina]|uniref:Cyclase family protein n=1 Tax=Candidatus Nitrospira allomarina TaxID=3020900 RepID=A0AA96JQM1_9BACT|nr:cyclase family protein [Candidatus Nitrospira allomarina]WNM56592.1 cyclase family protein [Candidatus Nitrospira allomarina]